MFFFIIPILFVGCTQIPFDKFILDGNGESVEENVNVNFKHIDTNDLSINNKTVEMINGNIEKLLNETIEHDNYIKYYKNNNFLDNISDLFDKESINNLKKDNNEKIYKLGKNIYLLEDSYEYYDFSLINLNYNAEEELYGTVNVYSITDSKDFLLNVIKINFTNDYLIKKIEIISENNIVKNTEKSLDENSLLNGNLLEEVSVINSTFDKLKNISLLEKLDYKEIDYFIEDNLEVEDYDLKLLENIFVMTKGNFNNYYLINYEVNDLECMALSNFSFRFINENNEKIDILITYSRVENKIIKVSKV